jgi:hypothetical protein
LLRRRQRTVAVALLGAAVAGGAAAATTLNSTNSIPFGFFARSSKTFTGTNCGATATVTWQLPAGATGITVATPRIGDRDEGGGGTRVSAVAVTGTLVTITVVADGPSICDPTVTGVPAGEPVNWTATYGVRAEYRRRVQATIRIFYESYDFGARWQLRPKTIRDTRAGGGPGARVTGIRWTRFGGRTAVGSGTLRLDYCGPRDNCPENGKRIRLVASKPGYCKDSGRIEYLRLSGYIGRIDHFNNRITCSG